MRTTLEVLEEISFWLIAEMAKHCSDFLFIFLKIETLKQSHHSNTFGSPQELRIKSVQKQELI